MKFFTNNIFFVLSASLSWESLPLEDTTKSFSFFLFLCKFRLFATSFSHAWAFNSFFTTQRIIRITAGCWTFICHFFCMGGKGTCVKLLLFSSSKCCLSFLAIFLLFSLSACLFHLPYLKEQYIHSLIGKYLSCLFIPMLFVKCNITSPK